MASNGLNVALLITAKARGPQFLNPAGPLNWNTGFWTGDICLSSIISSSLGEVPYPVLWISNLKKHNSNINFKTKHEP